MTAPTLSNRGAIFRQKGDFDHALANFNLAIKINPHYAGTYFNRGLLYKEEGKFDLALADFNKALQLEPNDRILYELRAQTQRLLAAEAPIIRISRNQTGGVHNQGGIIRYDDPLKGPP